MKKKRLCHKSPVRTCQDEIDGVEGQKENMKMEISTLLKSWMNNYFDYDDQIDN